MLFRAAIRERKRLTRAQKAQRFSVNSISYRLEDAGPFQHKPFAHQRDLFVRGCCLAWPGADLSFAAHVAWLRKIEDCVGAWAFDRLCFPMVKKSCRYFIVKFPLLRPFSPDGVWIHPCRYLSKIPSREPMS